VLFRSSFAEETIDKPWFAIGGIDLVTVSSVIEHGAQRIVVVRALTHAADPTTTARTLRAQLETTVVAPALKR
jgi:thiamine-phosphate pyrophosphorylase